MHILFDNITLIQLEFPKSYLTICSWMIFVFNQELRFFVPSVFAITLHVVSSRWRYTPLSFNMESEDQSMEKAFVLKTIIPSFHVRFRGCIIGSFFNHCTNITNWYHPKIIGYHQMYAPIDFYPTLTWQRNMLPWSSAEVRVRKKTQSTKHNKIFESECSSPLLLLVCYLELPTRWTLTNW